MTTKISVPIFPRFKFYLLFPVLLLLSQCIFQDEDTGIVIIVQGAGPVAVGKDPVSISQSDSYKVSVNQTNDTLAIIYEDLVCRDSGVLSLEGFTSMEAFLITPGQLYIWDGFSCQARLYTGGSGTIAGLWSLSGISTIPPPHTAPPFCDSLSAPTGNVTEQMTITSTQMIVTYSSPSFCWAQMWAENITKSMAINQAQGSAVATDCNQINITVNGATLVVRLDMMGIDPYHEKYSLTYGTFNCDYTSKQVNMTDAICLQAWNSYVADTLKDPFFYPYFYLDTGNSASFQTCMIQAQVPTFFAPYLPFSF